jgi:hypothetical protein
LILAYKYGSASLREAGKAVPVSAALKPGALAAAPGPLIDLGLIRRIGPAQPGGAFGTHPNDARYEIVDHDRCLAWIKNSYRPATAPPSGRTTGE